MRSMILMVPLTMMATTCAQACAATRGLYDALVHNSGAPPRDERARIEARAAEMLRELPRRRLAVLPVAVLGRPVRYDAAAAALIVTRLRADGIADAHVRPAPLELPFTPQPNEAAIFWTRFKALADSIAAHPDTSADYVLLVDVFGAPERASVGAVHALSVTSGGAMAYRGAWNSHQALYKEFRPASMDDVARMLAADVTRRRK